MNQTKHVISVDQAGVTSKGTPYWEAKYDDGHSDKFFDASYLEIFQDAIAHSLPVEVTKEKKGQYWNLTGVTLLDKPTLLEVAKELGAVPEKEYLEQAKRHPPLPVSDEYSRTKMRSMSISYAKDLCCAGKIEISQMSAYADKFLEYITKEQ